MSISFCVMMTGQFSAARKCQNKVSAPNKTLSKKFQNDKENNFANYCSLISIELTKEIKFRTTHNEERGNARLHLCVV